MERFLYRAARGDGSLVRGIVEAASCTHAGALLLERGLHPLSVDRAEPSEDRLASAPRRDLAIVFRSIAALAGAGVPIEQAVAASETLAGTALRARLANTRTRLHEGQSLAQGLAASEGVVPPLVLGMLRAGERSSRLGPALEQVAAHLEQEAELVSRVRQALAYPALLATAGLASLLIIGTLVVPKFAAILDDLGQDLPPATRLLLAGSSLLVRHGVLLALGLATLAGLAVEVVRRPDGRLALHRILLGFPAVGAVRHALATARFCRALSGTLESGVPLLPALAIARDAAGDRAVAERIGRARDRVAQGQPLARVLGEEHALAPNALRLLAVGEAGGRLAAMAGQAGDLAAQEAERGLRTAVGLLEPALVVALGGLVAFVAAALLQAVYSIRPGAG